MSKFESMVIETIQNQTQREKKRMLKNEKNIRELCDNFSWNLLSAGERVENQNNIWINIGK